jgi:putative membrane protein
VATRTNARDRGRAPPREPLAAIERNSQDVRDSAKDVHRATEHVESSAERSTRLAADRTVLAAERTYAAWVRTGLFALASAIGARAMLTGLMPGWLIVADSLALIAFSVVCFAAAVWRELRPSAPPPEPRVHALPPAMLIVMNTFLALVSIAAGVGIFTGSMDK